MKNKIRVGTQLLLLHYEVGVWAHGRREKLGKSEVNPKDNKIIGLTKKKPSPTVFNKTFQVLETTLCKFLIFEIIYKTGKISHQRGSRRQR